MTPARPNHPLRWINLLWRKRVLQAMAVFFGAAWGLVEVVSFAVARYRLTDNVVDMVGLGLLLLLPSALAWSLRSRPDPDDLLDERDFRFTSVNLLLATALVWAVFQNEVVGRATETITVAGEDGQPQTHEVPRASLIRSIGLSPLRRREESSPAWLGIAAAQLLYVDLSQHALVRPNLQWKGSAEIGGDPGEISLPRRQEMAQRARQEFFVEGEFAGTAERPRLQLRLYRTEPLRPIAEFSSEGERLTDAIDTLSAQLLNHLDLPADRAFQSADGPVEAMVSASPQAIEALFEGELALATRRDLPSARASIEEALEADPEFALAGLRLYQLGVDSGDMQSVRRGLAIAFESRERFTESWRCYVRILQASVNQQMDTSRRIARACVERFPDSSESRLQYASLLLAMDEDIEGAIAQFEAVAHLGGSLDGAMLQIASLRRRLGDEQGAVQAYEDYLELHPFDPSASIALAGIEERRGEPEMARNRLLEAIAHQDRAPELQVALALFFVRQGRHSEALEVITPFELGDTQLERQYALRVRERIAESSGRVSDALSIRDQYIAASPTGTHDLARLSRAIEYSEVVIAEADGLAALDALLLAAYPGEDEVAALLREANRLRVAIEFGTPADLERGKAAISALIERFKRRDYGFLLTLVEARERVLAGDSEGALPHFQRAHAAFRRSGGNAMVSEVDLLRLWLDAAGRSARAESGRMPSELLARLAPAHPRVLLARARFHA
ncbi:MAG: tetratricopeptide repeat protein, partial [Aquimonas sp.]